MDWLKQRVFIKIFFAFLAGVLFAFFFWEILAVLFASIGVFFAVIFVNILIRKHKNYRYNFVVGMLMYLLFFLIGNLVVQIQNPLNKPNHITNFQPQKAYYKCRIIDMPQEKTKSIQLETVCLQAMAKDSTLYFEKSKLLLYVKKDSISESLQYGDEIIVFTWLNEVSPPKNPGEFNYKQYLTHRNIYHQAFVKQGNLKLVKKNQGNAIIGFAHQTRKKALSILQKAGLEGKEFAVISAIILGYKDLLDWELINQYAGSGAIHVLCVSGLHVGIIYYILYLFLFKSIKSKKHRFIRSLIITFFIWIYALITGFSPSVLRASTMFTFIALGHSFSRKTDVYISLAASAFFLILFNPNIIFYVGFQLSYLAVLGIVMIYPVLYHLLYVKNKILDYAWSLLCVSIAAQLLTFPLSIYYFHQFPNLFFLTNLIVIPMVSILIWTAVAVFFFGSFSVYFPGLFLYYEAKFLNFFVQSIDRISFSKTEHIFVYFPEMLAVYLLLIFLFSSIARKQKAFVYLALGVLSLLSVFWFVNTNHKSKQQQIIISAISKSTVVQFVLGSENTLLTNDSLSSLEIDFHLQDYWDELKIREIEQISLQDSSFQSQYLFVNHGFVQFFNEKLLIISNADDVPSLKSSFSISYILMTNNSKVDLKKLAENYQPKMMITDGSSNYYYKEKIKKECEECGIAYHDTSISGALIISPDGIN